MVAVGCRCRRAPGEQGVGNPVSLMFEWVVGCTDDQAARGGRELVGVLRRLQGRSRAADRRFVSLLALGGICLWRGMHMTHSEPSTSSLPIRCC